MHIILKQAEFILKTILKKNLRLWKQEFKCVSAVELCVYKSGYVLITEEFRSVDLGNPA